MSLVAQAAQVAQALAPASVTVEQVASVEQQPNRLQTEMQLVVQVALVAQQPVAAVTAASLVRVAQRLLPELSEQQLAAQVDSEVTVNLPSVALVAPVVQHQQTSERALHEVGLAETAEL